ncbi:hypothetical protein [Scytonema sp. NUACC26]|uniref:hypothetical protein n=1 Tax=Scytonema sp. NUACC26 TaxID=3140176 RepID=UPI0034DBFD7F
MKYYQAQTVNSVACCLSCALNRLTTLPENSLLETAKHSLSTAVFLMDEYYRTWHSIIWIKSTQITKKRVQEKLNNLAFDAYTAFLKATQFLDLYVDSQWDKEQRGQSVEPPPPWWHEMMESLQVAESCFDNEHRHEILGKQLHLFETGTSN